MNREKRHAEPRMPSARTRDWRRLHHSPLFWAGFCLFLVAIAYYLWSDDLSWVPRLR